ncbi:MAG: hypothetical protein EPO19_17515, partial [Betaproteobacteria bacterium]
LAALRGQLRGIVSSVIGDQQAYVRSVEQEYRQLWQRWCEESPAASPEIGEQNIGNGKKTAKE